MKHIQKLRKLILTFGILAGMGMTAYAAGGGTEVTQANVICQQYSYFDANYYGGSKYSTPPVEITNITLADAQAFGAAVNCPTTYWVVVYATDGDNLKWTSNGKTGEQTSTPESAKNGSVLSAWCMLYNDDVFHFGGNYEPNKQVTFYFSKGLATVDVASVTLNKNSATLTVGDTESLTATVSPSDATDKTVTWSSDNTSVATVDATGLVTAVAKGTANITVTATNGTDDTSDDKTATCTITVTANKSALNTAITAAETLYNSIKEVEDYSTIASTLSTAIDAAKNVAGSDTADQNAVDAATTAITTAKTNAEAAIEKVKADTAAANAVIAKINALPATNAITSANKDAIEAARAAYDALTDDQKAKISDTVKDKLKAAETAVVAAEFNEYKKAQKTAAENKAQDGDSDATNALITAAKATIDALTYDATKTLAENKAAVTAVVTKLATDIAAQRAAEQPVTVAAKADPSTTGAYYATFYDSTTSYVADCEVYYATANADGRLTLQKAEGNVIKAGEGVILKATSETVTLTQTDAAASYDSLLIGSNTETTVENALVLSLGKNGVWFYKYSGTLGANKAYLAQ